MAVTFASTMAMRDESDPDWLTNELMAFDNIWLVLLWGGLLVVLGDVFAQALQAAWGIILRTDDWIVHSQLDTILVVPATIIFNVLYWREREGKTRPFSEQLPPFLIAIVLASVSYFAIQNLWLLPRLWGVTVPTLIQEWAANPQKTVILAFAMVGVLAQRRAIPLGIAIVSLAAVVGGIGTVLLSYPAYVTLFERFVPDALTVTAGDRTAVTIQTILAILLFLATGPLIAWWLRPGTRRRQLFIAAVTGALIATFLYGFLIGPITVIAAQSPIYSIATTRVGLGGFDWAIQLAEAVNNVIIWATVPIWGLWLVVAALVGLAGWLTPPPPIAEDADPPLALLGPVLGESANVGSNLIMVLGITVFVAVVGLLIAQVQFLFDRVGVQPNLSPGLGLSLAALQYLAVLIAQAVVFLWWLYQRVIPLVSQLPPTTESRVLLAQTSVSVWLFGGLFVGLGILIVSIFDATTFLLALVLVMAAVGVEIIFAATQLSTRLNEAKESATLPEPTVNHWLGISLVWSVFVTVIIYQFLLMVTSLVLITITLIEDLTISANPPIGTTALTDILTNAFTFMQTFFAPLLLVLGLMQLTLKDPMIDIVNYLRESRESDEATPPPIRHRWLANIPFLQRPYFWLEAKLVQLLQPDRISVLLFLSGVVALLTTTNPLVPFIFLSASMLLWPKGRYLDQLPASLFTLTLFLTLAGIFLSGFPDNEMAASLWQNSLVRLLWGVTMAVTLRAFRLYQPLPALRRVLRLFVALTTVFLLIPYTADAQSSLQAHGEVARFDGENWQTIPELSGTIGYDFFQDSQGQLWLTSGTGIIVTQVDGTWQRYAVFGTRDTAEDIGPLHAEDTDEQRIAKLEQEMVVVEDPQGYLWLALGKEFGRFNPAYYLEENETNLLTLSRADGAETLTQFDSLITDMILDDAGNLWLATAGSGLARVDTMQPMDEADWQTYTTTNSDILTDQIYALLYFQDQLWLGTDIGLIYSNENDWQQTAIDDNFLPPYTSLWVDFEGNIWAANENKVASLNGVAWLDVFDISQRFSAQDTLTITSHFLDREGKLWVGVSDEIGFGIFNGITWSIANIPASTTIIELPSGIWVGGQNGIYGPYETVNRNMLITLEQAGESSIFFGDLGGPSKIGPSRALGVDVEGALWASMFEIEQTTQTAVWSLYIAGILLVGLWGSSVVGYQRAPETRARRLERRLQKRPELLFPTVYDLLSQKADAPLVLAELTGYLEAHDPTGAQTLRVLGSSTHQVMDEKPEEPLVADERVWGEELNALYRVLAAAEMADRISSIVALELAVNPGTQAGEFYLTWREGQTPILPPFLPDGTEGGWRALERVTVALRKYEEVDAATDRLSYLAQALTAVEAAQTAVNQIGLPEGPLMQTIADNWRTAVNQEIDTISGHAELRLELRTRQVRRAKQVTIALRLQNVGRAAAETVTVTFAFNKDEPEIGDPAYMLPRLPSGQSELVEFSVKPPETDSLRIICSLYWKDRNAELHTLDFADVVRFYETAEEFSTIPNPYIVGHPVKGAEMFHGREDAFRFIAQNLEGVADRTLVLHGQRRTGKTSILYQLLNGRLGSNFLPVLIDMQELAPIIESTADFLGEMAYQLARTVQKAGIEIEEPEIEAFEKAAVRTFNRFLDRLEDSLGERRLVIMFDEFELIEGKIAEGKLEADLLGYFRSLMQHRQGLVFIFTGTHRLEEMSHDYWSILFNIALYRRVSFLSRADAVRLIREPVAGKLDVDELAVEKIINLTSGHAYFTQLICWALVNHCNAQQQNYATINDVNDAVSEVVRTGEAHFAFVWQQASSAERLALAALAHTLRPGKPWARPAELLETLQRAGDTQFERESLISILERLTLQEVLESASEGSLRYRFQLEILQLWLAATHSLTALVEKEGSN